VFLMSEVPLYYEHGRHVCTPAEAVPGQDLARAELLYPECVCESTFLFGTFTLRVVHLGRSTWHPINGRGD